MLLRGAVIINIVTFQLIYWQHSIFDENWQTPQGDHCTFELGEGLVENNVYDLQFIHSNISDTEHFSFLFKNIQKYDEY